MDEIKKEAGPMKTVLESTGCNLDFFSIISNSFNNTHPNWVMKYIIMALSAGVSLAIYLTSPYKKNSIYFMFNMVLSVYLANLISTYAYTRNQ